MKKSLILLYTIISFASFAQHVNDHDIEGKCSHQKSYANHSAIIKDFTKVADKYDMKFLHLDLLVSSSSTYIEGSALLNSNVLSATLDTIYLELNQTLSLDSMKLDGELVTPVFTNSEIFLLVDEMQYGENFELITYYHGSSSSSGFFSGITTDYNSTYNKTVTWTLSEPFSARDWFPIRQSLEDKIDSVFQDYTCIETEMVGTNGVLENIENNGDGTITYSWETRYPISYYLLSFSVSDYMEYNVYAHPEEMNGDSVLIQNFIYNDPACLINTQDDIDLSVGLLELLSDKYGLYPFHEEKYGNCLAEIGGGMEHQTMTTIGGFSFGLNAHEMGHQWYGDNITCATWSDIWINEGFASYSEYIAAEFIQGQSQANTWMSSAHNYIMSETGGSVYVPEDEIYYDNEWRIFDGRLTYKKGAAILHQLRYLINDDELFFGAMENYTNEYTDSIATGINFKNSVEGYTGIELDDYFNQWYFGEGYPTYSIEYSYNSTGIFIAVSQSTSASTPLFTLPLEVQLNFGAGQDTIIRIPISDNLTFFQTEITDPILLMQMDPDNWIINKTAGVSVGTREQENPMELVVGPNPTTSDLQLHFADSNTLKAISITDLSGREVLSYSTRVSMNIDISSLNSGYYMLKATDGKSTVIRKIMKQ